ncbi:MAG TPA: SRPBCC domain-containing protein [Ktedonobacterales bacterium]|nr:SRPBCC domain-containing protein [Ktedonobacterales bacterium]
MGNQQVMAWHGAIEQLPSPVETLIVSALYPGVAPERVFAFWITPDLLCAWWPQEAELDARVGGAYKLSWPKMGWRLRGRYTAVEPGRRLAFTWVWEHHAADVRGVEIRFTRLGDATAVEVRHGPYADTEADREVRNGHLEGWLHFLGRLGTALEDDTPAGEVPTH